MKDYLKWVAAGAKKYWWIALGFIIGWVLFGVGIENNVPALTFFSFLGMVCFGWSLPIFFLKAKNKQQDR